MLGIELTYLGIRTSIVVANQGQRVDEWWFDTCQQLCMPQQMQKGSQFVGFVSIEFNQAAASCSWQLTFKPELDTKLKCNVCQLSPRSYMLV
jgi:hypothetical protein